MCHDGLADAVLKELPTLTDGEWSFRGFAGLSEAPVVNNLPRSSRAHQYEHTMAEFCEKMKDARISSPKLSNVEPFGIA
jgi:hypothetical protein